MELTTDKSQKPKANKSQNSKTNKRQTKGKSCEKENKRGMTPTWMSDVDCLVKFSKENSIFHLIGTFITLRVETE